MRPKKIDFHEIKLLTYNPFKDFDSVERLWCTMLDRCPHSFFLSWDWMFTWLKTLPPETDIELVIGEIDGCPVFSFFLGKTKIVRHGVFHSRTIALNSTGKERFDDICIEYNDILVDPSYAVNFSEFLSNINLPMHWDEFIVPGIAGKLYNEVIEDSEWDDQNEYTVVMDRDDKVNWIDLERVRNNNMDYIGLLSSSTRSRIRRSNKAYEKNGAIQIEVAENKKEAFVLFEKLGVLNQKKWKQRGVASAFSNDYFKKFHVELINRCFDKGMIHLSRVHNSDSTIGFLYNFIFENNILGYQSAYNLQKDNRKSPGITALAHMVLFFAEHGFLKYDFLAGDAPYKKKLTTDSEEMCWAIIQKTRKRFMLEKKLKEIKAKIRNIRK